MACWNALFDQARVAFAQQRSAERARALGLSALTCLGRHTSSGLLCTAGLQFRDWSAAYRLFERERLAPQALRRVPRNGVLEILPLASAARAIPIDLQHAPSPRKPSRRAAAQQWQNWRIASAASTISRRGAERLTHLRHAIDQFTGGATRPLLVCADATFTNRTVLRDLPPRTTLIVVSV